VLLLAALVAGGLMAGLPAQAVPRLSHAVVLFCTLRSNRTNPPCSRPIHRTALCSPPEWANQTSVGVDSGAPLPR
jgi:hypothetical protein